MKKWVLIAMLLICGTAWAVDYDGRILADSGDAAILAISDTSVIKAQTLFIDTTYFPSANGTRLPWCNWLLYTYGIADFDTAMAIRMANDSSHIGFFLQSSLDGFNWSTIFEDTTMRTRFQRTGDSLTRHQWLDATTIRDTLIGQLFRTMTFIYRNVDSVTVETDTHSVYNIADTVYLFQHWLYGVDQK